jgi:hypothetical protein
VLETQCKWWNWFSKPNSKDKAKKNKKAKEKKGTAIRNGFNFKR